MQFVLTPNFKEKINNVKFLTVISPKFWLSFTNSLNRIGGKSKDSFHDWDFPYHITGQVIQEIIHNTCFVCGGLMQDSTAIQNTLVSSNDFGNDVGKRGTTQSRIGPAKQIIVRKCTSCGHSHT